MYGKQNLQEQKILYVCFEVNRINFFNLSFGIIIVNAPKNNQCFDEMARKYLARFPHSPILHYAYGSLFKENNSAYF